MKKVWIWVLVIIVILVAIRITLPFVAEKYANNAIEKMEGYYGTFNLYYEIVIDDATLDGYVRPVLENLEILDWDEEKGGFSSKAREAVAGGVRAIFENPEEDQVATQTPLEGSLNNEFECQIISKYDQF